MVDDSTVTVQFLEFDHCTVVIEGNVLVSLKKNTS